MKKHNQSKTLIHFFAWTFMIFFTFNTASAQSFKGDREFITKKCLGVDDGGAKGGNGIGIADGGAKGGNGASVSWAFDNGFKDADYKLHQKLLKYGYEFSTTEVTSTAPSTTTANATADSGDLEPVLVNGVERVRIQSVRKYRDFKILVAYPNQQMREHPSFRYAEFVRRNTDSNLVETLVERNSSPMTNIVGFRRVGTAFSGAAALGLMAMSGFNPIILVGSVLAFETMAGILYVSQKDSRRIYVPFSNDSSSEEFVKHHADLNFDFNPSEYLDLNEITKSSSDVKKWVNSVSDGGQIAHTKQVFDYYTNRYIFDEHGQLRYIVDPQLRVKLPGHRSAKAFPIASFDSNGRMDHHKNYIVNLDSVIESLTEENSTGK